MASKQTVPVGLDHSRAAVAVVIPCFASSWLATADVVALDDLAAAASVAVDLGHQSHRLVAVADFALHQSPHSSSVAAWWGVRYDEMAFAEVLDSAVPT